MSASSTTPHDGTAGLCRLPLRIRDGRKPEAPMPMARRIPDGLHWDAAHFSRLRSPTESSVSSISSANLPDSATTHTLSTLASPISTSYASDVHDLFLPHDVDASKSATRSSHRHQPSTGTCSTFVNEEDDGALVTGYPHLELKIRQLDGSDGVPEVHDVPHLDRLTLTELPKDPQTHTPVDSSDAVDEEASGDHASQDWENDSTTTSDGLSGEDGDAILDYTLQLAYGLELRGAPISPMVARTLVANFVRDIGRNLCQQAASDQLTQSTSAFSSSSTPSQGSGRGDGQNGKRKKAGQRDDDGDDFSDGEGSGSLGVKRLRPNPREEENLRLSCPFRKRNPHRFNVRDHYSCAMTYFPKFAELRQHIVKQHKRDNPSAYVCDRCNRNFEARKELRDHQRLPKEEMCDIADHDAESGIDGPTATKLLSRKRASCSSTQNQWDEVWHILFPDDEDYQIKSYDFTPVIEHFELSTHYLAAFQHLQTSLRDKISNPATLETLATKFHQCFVETLERCIADAQTRPYANRSNKKAEALLVRPSPPSRASLPRKSREILPRPDSGVVMMDDASEESGSVRGSAALTHRTSVRTVREASTDQRIPEAVPEVVPPPPAASLGHGFAGMMAPATMDLEAVDAWTNNVLYQQVDHADLGFMGYGGVPPESTTPQPVYLNWGTTGFDAMSNNFHGFNGQ